MIDSVFGWCILTVLEYSLGTELPKVWEDFG